ncbi:MAG TPA: hypothetical protein VIJ62_04030 [Rhizomicrobium sp.]
MTATATYISFCIDLARGGYRQSRGLSKLLRRLSGGRTTILFSVNTRATNRHLWIGADVNQKSVHGKIKRLGVGLRLSICLHIQKTGVTAFLFGVTALQAVEFARCVDAIWNFARSEFQSPRIARRKL